MYDGVPVRLPSAVICAARVIEVFTSPKSEDLHDVELETEPAQEQVLRLDVAVEHSFRVRLRERATDLTQQADTRSGGSGPKRSTIDATSIPVSSSITK
jgi:hypothetical protein